MANRVPSLNWLRVFEAAARTGSFARAAETLNMSRPAVSQQIQALETSLGRPLFKRGARSVALTDAGKAYLPTVARALHAIEMASSNLFGGAQTATLTLQCSLLLATGWLAPRLSEFTALHPGIRVNLMTGIHDAEFAPDRCDLRVLFGMPPVPHEVADPLMGERIYPVALPEIAAGIKGPKDLLHLPLIEIASHRTNWSSFLPADGEPRFVYTDNTLTALALAQQGAVALARAPASGDLPAQAGLVRCGALGEAAGVQSYTLAHAGETQLSPAARTFRTWLLDRCEET
ncbi:MAG: LysR family transcriptional regulator [Pseudomonadota bacterium]